MTTALPSEVYAALVTFASRDTVLVASDFDGVLAPIVLDPSRSRALPGTLEDLATLARCVGTHAAIVSGRDLSTLSGLTTAAGAAVTRIGSHGAEMSGGPRLDLNPDEARTLHAVRADLEELVAHHPGTTIESKPAAVVLHTRGAPPAVAAVAEPAALELATRHTGVVALSGKRVVELSVAAADKGSAVSSLARRLRVGATLYLGDDVTDEHVFTVLGRDDIGIKVGPGDTAAQWRVPDPDSAAAVLRAVTSLRA